MISKEDMFGFIVSFLITLSVPLLFHKLGFPIQLGFMVAILLISFFADIFEEVNEKEMKENES